jgi:hypothetical protein
MLKRCKWFAGFLSLLLILGLAGADTKAEEVIKNIESTELKKLSLDDASVLGTTITTDTNVKSEGNGSIRISTLWPTTICLSEVSGLDVENTTLIYQAKVKSEKLEGTAFLEMWCYVGSRQYFSRGLNSAVTDTLDWKTLQTPFMLQAGQKAEKVTLNIVINGKGTIWIDGISLFKTPLK